MSSPPVETLALHRTSRRGVWVVYAVILAMFVTVIVVGAAAVGEVRRISRPQYAQSLWHVYQTHEGVVRVMTAAQEAASGGANADKVRIELELLAAQVSAVHQFNMLDMGVSEYASAWRTIENSIDDGLQSFDRPGGITADRIRALGDRFAALRNTSHFLIVSSQQELNRSRDRFRADLIERFWQGTAAMTLLLAGLAVLLWRAHAAQRQEAALADRLIDLNRTLEARVSERTHEIEADRALSRTVLEASPSAIALIREADGKPLYFNARMRQALALSAMPAGPFPADRLFADPLVAEQIRLQLDRGLSIQDHDALIAGDPPFHALVSARRVTVRDEPALLVWLHDHSQRKRLELELQRLATTDALTGLTNRRAFFEQGRQMLELTRRYGHACSLLMIDIDHFKAVNDRHGHHAGDQVLRTLADRLRDVLRQADLVARLGGEEFSALMPTTDLDAAAYAAERVRELCEGLQPDLAHGSDAPVSVSVSVGVAQWRQGETLEHLLERADAALYRAKRAGRNRVEVAP